MKALFVSLFGLFAVTAIITHIWTTIIGFDEGGFWGGVATLFLPFLSEIYWTFKMYGENNVYAVTALIHLILAIPFSMVDRSERH